MVIRITVEAIVYSLLFIQRLCSFLFRIQGAKYQLFTSFSQVDAQWGNYL